MSHTTRSRTDALTFIHDGTPDGGDLAIVVNLHKAERYNVSEQERSTYGFNRITVETQRIMGEDTVTLTVPYNEIRNFVLGQLRNREIANLEQLSDDALVAHYINKSTE